MFEQTRRHGAYTLGRCSRGSRRLTDVVNGEVLDLLENEAGMHSCLEPIPRSPVRAGGKRRHPRGFENTGIGVDTPEA
jgi:hypothetical protein